MIKIWFLMAYIAYPNVPAISYQGFGGYAEKQKCENLILTTENYISNLEINRGTTAYVNVRCEEIYAFPTSLKSDNSI